MLTILDWLFDFVSNSFFEIFDCVELNENLLSYVWLGKGHIAGRGI
jgi:hypothetical protein